MLPRTMSPFSTASTRTGHQPDRNLAAQQAPDLIQTDPLCCQPGQGQRMHFDRLKRREFIALIGGAATVPLAVHAQQPSIQAIGILRNGSRHEGPHLTEAFRQGFL
jgi:hypothetical protein